MARDYQYYKNLLMSVAITFTDELKEHEKKWDQLDDFMRSEYLAVDVEDAWRRLGKLQDAEKSGELPDDLRNELRRVEWLAREAEPRIEKLKLSTEI